MQLIQTTLLGNGVEVTSDLEGGNADVIRVVGEIHVEVEPRDDGVPHELQVKGPLSCYNVCVLLRNDFAASADLTLDVVIPPWLIESGFSHFLRNTYYERSPDNLDYAEIPAPRAADLGARMRFSFRLKGHERRIFSSVPHYPYSACVQTLRALGSTFGAKLKELGKSFQGRPVYALEFGNSGDRPRIVVAGTHQSGEPVAWSILSMIEWLTGTDVGRRYLDTFQVDFVPQPNPDGHVLGLCNTNSAGDLAEMGFADAAAGRCCPPETQIHWDYLCSRPPLAYLEIHCHRLANREVSTLGFPEGSLYSAPDRSEQVEHVVRHMARFPVLGRIHRWGKKDPFWSRFAVYHTAERLGAISCVDQYTGAEASLAGLRERGPRVLASLLAALTADQ